MSSFVKLEDYDFDDDSFGLSTACRMANDCMVAVEAPPAKAEQVLTGILQEWPDIYARGGRIRELASLVVRLVRASLAIVFLLFLLSVPNVDAETSVSRYEKVIPREQARFKREGFGPWEANDAWDEKGKSNIKPMMENLIKILVNETESLERVINGTIAIAEEVIEVFEHPVRELKKSAVGIIILILACSCFVGLVIKLIFPMLRILWSVFLQVSSSVLFIFKNVISVIKKLTCCMIICSWKPFRIIRNKIHRRRMEREDLERLEVFSPAEEMKMLKKTYSSVHTDDTGIYLLADDHHRVYLHPERQTEDLLMLRSFSGTNREKGFATENVKEAVLSSSKLYKTDKIPDFQGTFEVDGNLMGHFSRIKFNGLDCLLTAYHVLEYNKMALLNIRKGDKCLKWSSINAKVVAASKSEHYDFLILAVPSCVFSTLGMKVGVWTPRAQPREPIQIYQFYEGKPCVSSAAIKVSSTKPWHVEYAASTTVGTSGAPILDSKNRIIGVHLESDKVAKLNVGVIPPVFRTCKKESPTNEDLAQGQPDLEEIEDAEYYKQFEQPENEDDYDDEYYEMEAYETYLAKEQDSLEIYREGVSWGEFMEDHAEKVAQRMYEKYGEKYHVYTTKTGASGKHIQNRIKGDRYRVKESPWSCSECAFIQSKGYNCVNCGAALKRSSRRILRQQVEGAKVAKEEVLDKKLPAEIVEKVMDHVERDSFIKLVALEVMELLKSSKERLTVSGGDIAKRGDHLKEEVMVQKLYPTLPCGSESVPMDKKLAQQLKVTKSGAGLRIGEENHLCLMIPNVTEKSQEKFLANRSPRNYELNKFPVVKVRTQKEANTVVGKPGEGAVPLSKSAKRRLRMRKKKQLALESKLSPAVPLNSEAPEKSGDPTINGLKNPSPSQSNLRGSERVSSGSQIQGKEKKPTNGKKRVKKTRPTQSTVGLPEEQKLRKPALNSNVTSTS